MSNNPYDEEKDADARLSWGEGRRKARQHDYDEDDTYEPCESLRRL